MDNKNIKMQKQSQTQADFENAAVSQSEIDVAIESPLHKMLKRDIEAEALKRLEESAVSEKDFKEVIRQWDRLDRNRERKERYHEVYRNDEDFPLELGAAIGTNFATNIHMLRQAFKGNFLEIIYNSPHEIQEHITEKYLFEILRDLKSDYKELLYYRAIEGYSNTEFAKLEGCTSRNIRKKWAKMIDEIQEQIYEYLSSDEAKQHHDFMITERAFLKRYEEKLKEKLNIENEERK